MTTRFAEVGPMVQLGFFDADKRLTAISAKGDPLEMIDRVVPFESFRAEIEGVVLPPAENKKSNDGRKPTTADIWNENGVKSNILQLLTKTSTPLNLNFDPRPMESPELSSRTKTR